MASSPTSPTKTFSGNGAPRLPLVVLRGDASGLTKHHRVILLFYPLDFTFVVSNIPRLCHNFRAEYLFNGLFAPQCPTELVAFADAAPKFGELNTVVLGVSCDSKFSHLAWTQQDRRQGGLGPNFALPLLADKTMKIARDYGVLLEDEGIALRGLFIIDPKGVLR